MSDALFLPVQVGQCHLRHRVIMAPMTRRRALADHTPADMMVEYYAQRAAAPGTLLISEATSVSPRSTALPSTPGLFTAEQIEAWKPITAAVHARGSYIFAQLWICGRAARAGAVRRGAEVVSASDVPLDAADAPVPRPLTEPEILQLIDDYRTASVNAIGAGFDGVEIHGANGYLVDQFTQDVSNRQTDAWGGSVEKRARFGIEVARAVVGAIGADRVGYRVSPWSRHHSMRMEDPVPQFSYLVTQLRELKLAYLHVIEARVMGNADSEGRESIKFLVDIWGRTSPVIVAGGYDEASAREAIETVYLGADVLVGFGRAFISNPDLPRRIQNGLPLAKYNRDLFYEVLEPRGYTDYPPIREWDGQHSAECVHNITSR
ncbi:NADH:flavin oxidoreductase/NADH oxidase family protein [Coniochaeta ligniaria NRRL 30616]|uniref:NADH:flavin oxidoreductase/NADH oxidase family protein n=1 Tax=Coniochaeta ligniaria NRRL 30616 TaxID=1408157 RepID=A0A1J7I4U6_9PEZI|nr:NADH:flavin oxidoreductase/NADH oxidase family protein [Coniochaeta ligniaria NRRL 30616]